MDFEDECRYKSNTHTLKGKTLPAEEQMKNLEAELKAVVEE